MFAVLSLTNEDFLKLLDHSCIPLKGKSHDSPSFAMSILWQEMQH
jgi:hypothetical protein